MLIITKENLKGELYISAIGHTLRSGKSVTIDDSYAKDPDILWAISKGLIDVEIEDGGHSSIMDDGDYITVKNSSNRILNMSFINKIVDPGVEFTLSHDDFNSSDASMLINKGWIEAVISTDNVDIKPTNETPKKKTSKKKTSKKKTKSKSSSADSASEEQNKENPLINENNSIMDTVTISFPEVDDDGIVFVDNNNNEVN